MTVVAILVLPIILLLPCGLADENEHIHIKLHLPDLLKKHTHVRTIYKHHFHPKKPTTHSHLIKDSLGNKFEPESSFTMLNPMFSLPKANSFPHLDGPANFWLPHENPENIMALNGIRPSLKPLQLNQNWDAREVLTKLTMPPMPFESPMHLQNNRGYGEDGGLPSSMKDIDDDEDEEYTMTEDSVHELPLALQMQLKDSDNHGGMLKNTNNGMWNRLMGRTKMPSDSPQFAQFMNNEQPFSLGGLDDMQGYESFRNMMQMQGNLDSMPELAMKGMKSLKRLNKGKNKKRKRLNMNQATMNSFRYN